MTRCVASLSANGSCATAWNFGASIGYAGFYLRGGVSEASAVGPLLGAAIVLLFAHLATAGAQASASITLTGEQAGFAGLFVASGVLAVLGGVAMIPIKSVK